MPTIDHIVVLMLENRSFDFMLGYMKPFPQSSLALTGREHNPLGYLANPDSARIWVNDKGVPGLPVSPDHSHRGVLHQLFGRPVAVDPGGAANCSGFVNDYEAFYKQEQGIDGQGSRIMACLDPYHVPVLTTLARSFALFLRWHCSVPGETWPNRNFAHAATSSGQVNIDVDFYDVPTIFGELGKAGRNWVVFHDGIPQVWAFPEVLRHDGHGASEPIAMLLQRIGNGTLPAYSFVEPKHFGRDTNSQHPGNNTTNERDFRNGELLIARIYQALRANPSLFERTAFLVTYDEHGGHWDHVPPPRGPEWMVPESHKHFRFDLLGPRVPSVLISPWVAAGTADDSHAYDHSSIVAMVRRTFAPVSAPFNGREKAARNPLDLLTATARSQGELPDLSSEVEKLEQFVVQIPAGDGRLGSALDGFQKSLVKLGRAIPSLIGPHWSLDSPAARTMTLEAMDLLELDHVPIEALDAEGERIVQRVRRSG